MRSFLTSILLPTLAVSLAATACTSSVLGADRSSNQLVVALAEAPDALDPTTSSTFVSRIVYANMCEKLYDVDANLNIVPQLAAALPRISPDGLTYTIQLRQGIRFNDGTPLNAAAVKTTLHRYVTFAESNRAAELGPLTSVEVVDPMTVRLHLSKPFAPFTSILADRSGMILSPAQLRKLGDNFARHPVCVGPFSFAARPSADEIDLVRSKYYYDRDKVHLDGLQFQVVVDSNIRVADMRAGDVDVVDRVAPQDVVAVKDDPDTTEVSRTSLGYQGIDLNVGNAHGALKDSGSVDNPFSQHPELRQAFELSLDRSVINKIIFEGQYVPDCSPIPTNSPWTTGTACSGRDVAKAKALVAHSGVKTPIKVPLMVQAAALPEQLGTIIQSMAKDAGFDVQVQPTEFTTALKRAQGGKFTMFQIGWSGRLDPDQNIFSFYAPHSGLNYTGSDDPAIVNLLNNARTSTDEQQRKSLYRTLVDRLNQERSIIYLYHPSLVLGLRKSVSGVQFYGDGLIRLKTAQIDSGA
ncbi:MAG TPA: ABC transporter substrate-binding protein [Mycobacteriales bacterium]|nr:ABC transporter substrate-binding protein [Mycobacteriales bacterium]